MNPDLPAAIFTTLRPRQWTKNALVFAGLLFTIEKHHPAADFARVLGAFLAFCLLSGFTYVLNDIVDVEADRQHPKKRLRPIAAGRLPLSFARVIALLGTPLTLALAILTLGVPFGAVALLYLLVTVSYSFYLKNIVLVDVLAVASGFVLRAVAGSVVIGVVASEWLLLCTFLLALFLALSKRRGEIVALGDAPPTRAILAEYSVPMLDQMIVIVASACLITYSLYTFFSDSSRHYPYRMATIPFVLYGLFRYLYLAQKKNIGETPETVLLEDLALKINLLLWILTAMAALIFAPH